MGVFAHILLESRLVRSRGKVARREKTFYLCNAVTVFGRAAAISFIGFVCHCPSGRRNPCWRSRQGRASPRKLVHPQAIRKTIAWNNFISVVRAIRALAKDRRVI